MTPNDTAHGATEEIRGKCLPDIPSLGQPHTVWYSKCGGYSTVVLIPRVRDP
jgi:hypothetical protein